LKLIAYVKDGEELDIRPAQIQRDWMNTYIDRFAYGCLPMAIANTHGWEILSPVSFTAIWNGGANKDCLAILQDGEPSRHVFSHFGHGIVSISLPAVFETEPGYDLYVQGPPNNPIDGATPFAGIVETDWLWTSIGMHWQLTQPVKAVRFHKGQPICQIFPIQRTAIENFEPEIRSMSERPELQDYMKDWGDYRERFKKALKDPNSEERRKKWPPHYRKGVDLHGNETAPETHRTKVRLKPFADRRGEPRKA
jgi:hypothetical protein